MAKKLLCDICGSQQDQTLLFSHYDNNYFVDKKMYSLVRCRNCGVVTIEKKPSPAQMGKYYENNYYSYDTSSSLFFRMKDKWTHFVAGIHNKTIANRLLFGGLFMLPIHKNAQALDVGCGDGSALLTLKTLGYKKLFGTEISSEVCKKLEKKGITAYCASDITTLKIKKNSFDLVRMSHVLEHVYNPRETVRFLKTVIAADGTLLVGVPNFDSLASKIFGKYFCALQIPTHLYHFNKKNIRKLLEDEGYEVRRVKTTGFSGISASLITLAKDRWNKKNIPNILTTALIIGLVPVELILNVIGQGYIMNIQAVKKT